MSCASGLRRRFGGVNRPILSYRSTATRFPLSLPKACAVTMNDWGAVNDVALLDLGFAPMDRRGAWAHRPGHGRAPVELCAGRGQTISPDRGRAIENRSFC